MSFSVVMVSTKRHCLTVGPFPWEHSDTLSVVKGGAAFLASMNVMQF